MTFLARLFGFTPARVVNVAELQRRLNAHGADLDVDGVWGLATDAAISAFKAARGWRDAPTLGKLTAAALMEEPAAVAPPVASGEPAWLTVARKYLGEREIKGPQHNPRILAWWRAINAPWFTDDETPWCGAFVGGVLHEAGLPVAKEAPRARAWATWGRGLAGPAVGCVVVFWRGSPAGTSGHVGFVVGKDERNRLMVLGGNQSDAVTIAPFDLSRVIAYRWPVGEPLPAHGMSALPVVDSRGAASSVNEA